MPADQREPVIDDLVEVWSSVVAACDGVEGEGWDRTTDCPGWTVKDQLSHLIGIERMLLGDPAPPVPVELPAHVKNDFGALNEGWVASRRAVPGPRVLAEFREVTDRRVRDLEAMPAARFDEMGWSPVGEAPYRVMLETRVLDAWAHEQDIRRALERPGGRHGRGEAVVLDRCEATMPFVVGKRVAPPEGTSVRFAVEGPLGRVITVVVEAGRAVAVADLPADTRPDVTLTTDQDTFWRLAYGRMTSVQAQADHRVRLDGDPIVGQKVLDGMAFMM